MMACYLNARISSRAQPAVYNITQLRKSIRDINTPNRNKSLDGPIAYVRIHTITIRQTICTQ